jgi:hypothetical protein
MKHADRGDARQKANDSGEHDQPPIVLGAQTVENAKHCSVSRLIGREPDEPLTDGNLSARFLPHVNFDMSDWLIAA